MSTETNPCAACGEPLEPKARKCEACENDPTRWALNRLVGGGAAIALGSIFFPPLLLLTVGLWGGAVILWIMAKARMGYWARYYGPTSRAWGADE